MAIDNVRALHIVTLAQLRLQRWSIFRAMRWRWFIFNSDAIPTILERPNIAIVAIIFLDHRERLFFDYFAHFENRLFCDYSRYARSARSGQREKNSSLNSVVINSTKLQNVKHSYPIIKFLQSNCNLSVQRLIVAMHR